MSRTGQDTLRTRKTLTVDGKAYDYFSLEEAARRIGDLSRLPFSLKVLLENLLRFEDGQSVTVADIEASRAWPGAARVRSGNRLPPRPRADAGLHRRARRRRSGRHARGHDGAGRRPAPDQPADRRGSR